jgi:probable rRNA maturation factor
MKIALSIQRASRLASIPSDALLRKWVRAGLAAVPDVDAATLTVRVVNASEGRELNHDFRGKDYATNVLTFVYHDEGSTMLMGDLVLCAPVVAKEAREQSKSVAAHYAHLCVHGVLHLAGFDHDTNKQAKVMEALEISVLAGLGLGNPY